MTKEEMLAAIDAKEESLRGSGRTTKLVMDGAMALLRREVFVVVAHTRKYAVELQDRIYEEARKRGWEPVSGTFGCTGLCTPYDRNPGPSYRLVFEDHHSLYLRAQKAIESL